MLILNINATQELEKGSRQGFSYGGKRGKNIIELPYFYALYVSLKGTYLIFLHCITCILTHYWICVASYIFESSNISYVETLFPNGMVLGSGVFKK